MNTAIMNTYKLDTYFPQITSITKAQIRLHGVIRKTPLELHDGYSERFGANISLKREDLQQVRSYKIRGAYNKISSLTAAESEHGIVCASAGNHAQGVALSCWKLKIKGTIFMPTTTPKQKIRKVKTFGKSMVEVILEGDSFDDAKAACDIFAIENKATIVPPFDDEKIIEGQATVGLEILEQHNGPIDYLFMPIGGGGLTSGVSAVFQQLSPNTKIIGVEPNGAPAMFESLKANEVITLTDIDTFADGVAVKRVGQLNFDICKETLNNIQLVHEGKICETMLELYDEDAIVVEPAGALSLAVLDNLAAEIKGKNIVCIISGGNNDITRTQEIQERALLYKGLKHYFIVNFPQRAGALKEFVNDVLGENDDIVYFEYKKKNSREMGPALVGIELKYAKDFPSLLKRMEIHNFLGEYLNEKPSLFGYIF